MSEKVLETGTSDDTMRVLSKLLETKMAVERAKLEEASARAQYHSAQNRTRQAESAHNIAVAALAGVAIEELRKADPTLYPNPVASSECEDCDEL